jgi:hypothetical protein
MEFTNIDNDRSSQSVPSDLFMTAIAEPCVDVALFACFSRSPLFFSPTTDLMTGEEHCLEFVFRSMYPDFVAGA